MRIFLKVNTSEESESVIDREVLPIILPCSSQVPPKYLPFFEREKKEEKGRDKGRKSDEVKYVECDTPRDFLARQQNVSLRSHDNLRLIYGHLRLWLCYL